MTHLLVTNDFPPKVGGIQSYLWELWRRLPPKDVAVLTTPYSGAEAFDRAQRFRIERSREPVLLPRPGLATRIRALARDVGADLVVFDPVLPLGFIGPRLGIPYALVLHGSEVTVPARLPGSRALLAHVLRHATHVIAAGGYPAAEARRAAGRDLPTTIVPPGVDVERFRPLAPDDVVAARRGFGLPAEGPLVASVSRLVPRKGMDVLIKAVARLDATTAVLAGNGRDRPRLERIAARHAPGRVRFLGRVGDDELPAVYGCADVFAMICRNRWAGLEQEGFGIVFAEAAACGVPSVAGDSGGAAEAVVDGETGVVVRRPNDVAAATTAIAGLLSDPGERARQGQAARLRTVRELSYDVLAVRLDAALRQRP